MNPNQHLKRFSIFILSLLMILMALTLGIRVHPVNGEILIDGVIDEGEYDQSLNWPSDDYQLFWRYEDDKVVIGMKAKTLGWVSFGISSPGKNKMDQADIMIGYVDNAGETKMFDMFSTSPIGPHPDDVSLGGTNDISVFTGLEIDGYTTIEFQRRMITGDKYDLPFPDSGSIKYIIGYGSKDDIMTPHIMRGSGDRGIIKKLSSLKPKEAKELYDTTPSLLIVDVSNAWKTGHLPGAINIELSQLDQMIPQMNKTRKTLVYSRRDDDTINAASKLKNNGYVNVYPLIGNFEGWVTAGYPIETYKEKTIIQFKIGQESYKVDGIDKKMDTKAMIVEGRTMLPIRFLAESIGARINWTPATQVINLYLGLIEIEMQVNNPQATVNGKKVMIDSNNPLVKPIVVPPGRTLLPLRFVAENLRCKVDWNAAKQEVTVTYLN